MFEFNRLEGEAVRKKGREKNQSQFQRATITRKQSNIINKLIINYNNLFQKKKKIIKI